MNLRNLVIWGVLVVVLIGLYSRVTGGGKAASAGEITYSQLLTKVNAGQIKKAEFRGPAVFVTDATNKTYTAVTPNNQDDLVRRLEGEHADISVKAAGGFTLVGFLLNSLPILLLIGVWIFFMRQMQGGARGAMGFGKSKAKLLTENKNRVTFDDVAGVDEAKDELTEIVDFLEGPAEVSRWPGRQDPQGLPATPGPPGTGKTLLAPAPIAGEAGVPFFTISGSDFVEMFKMGSARAACATCSNRPRRTPPASSSSTKSTSRPAAAASAWRGGNDEREEQTLNQLLVEMDGFEANEGIILIAATNRPDVLDPALLRPGRFDRQVVVPNPDINGRERILRVHMKNVPLAADVETKITARGTPGFSGADLAEPGQRRPP